MRREGVYADAGIDSGRLTAGAQGETTLYVTEPDTTALSVAQTHAKIRVVGDGFDATIKLDGNELEAVREALDDIAASADGESGGES